MFHVSCQKCGAWAVVPGGQQFHEALDAAGTCTCCPEDHNHRLATIETDSRAARSISWQWSAPRMWRWSDREMASRQEGGICWCRGVGGGWRRTRRGRRIDPKLCGEARKGPSRPAPASFGRTMAVWLPAVLTRPK